MLFFFFLRALASSLVPKHQPQRRRVCLISVSPRSSRPGERVFPNSFCSCFRFLLMPVDCQSTKALIYSGVAPILRAVCSRSILPPPFSVLPVSILLIMHGACSLSSPSLHSSLSLFLADWLILLRWICWIRCASGKRAFGSRLHQSPPPYPTTTTTTPSGMSPLMNRPAAHYWRHFTLAWHGNERWQSAFELLAPGKRLERCPPVPPEGLWFMKSLERFLQTLWGSEVRCLSPRRRENYAALKWPPFPGQFACKSVPALF